MENRLFAKALACSDNKEQAEFLNEFCRHLKMMCNSKVEEQLCWIAQYVTPDAVSLLADLVEFCKLQQESRKQTMEDIQDLYHKKYELEKEIDKLMERKINYEQG